MILLQMRQVVAVLLAASAVGQRSVSCKLGFKPKESSTALVQFEPPIDKDVKPGAQFQVSLKGKVEGFLLSVSAGILQATSLCSVSCGVGTVVNVKDGCDLSASWVAPDSGTAIIRLVVVQSYARKQAVEHKTRVYVGLSKAVDRTKQHLILPVVASVTVIDCQDLWQNCSSTRNVCRKNSRNCVVHCGLCIPPSTTTISTLAPTSTSTTTTTDEFETPSNDTEKLVFRST